MIAWLYLAVAALFEIAFAMSMKYSEGFSRLTPTLVTAVAVVLGITFLTLAMKTLPVSVAYPVWTGVGTLGTVLLGYLLLGEQMTTVKLLSIVAIVAGVAGLKISTL